MSYAEDFKRAYDDWYYLQSDGGIPEGTVEEWHKLLDAFEARDFKVSIGRRLDFFKHSETIILIYSPRNAYGSDDGYMLHMSDIDQFVHEIRGELAHVDGRVNEGAEYEGRPYVSS